MEFKPPVVSILPLLVFVLSLDDFSVSSAVARSSSPFPVRVGVVLDMDDDLGKMGFICIKMALSGFYKKHTRYRTRLILHSRDSKKDVVGATAAGLYLTNMLIIQFSVSDDTMGKLTVCMYTFSIAATY